MSKSKWQRAYRKKDSHRVIRVSEAAASTLAPAIDICEDIIYFNTNTLMINGMDVKNKIEEIETSLATLATQGSPYSYSRVENIFKNLTYNGYSDYEIERALRSLMDLRRTT